MKTFKITKRIVTLAVVCGTLLLVSNSDAKANDIKDFFRKVRVQVNVGNQRDDHDHGRRRFNRRRFNQPRFNQPPVLIGQPVIQGPVNPLILPGDIHDHRPQIQLGVRGHFTQSGLCVESVVWGSYAQRVGIEAGDVIAQINGHRIDCLHDFNEALSHWTDHVDLVVWDVHGRGYVSRTIHLHGFGPAPAPLLGNGHNHGHVSHGSL